ncbi:MAG TPA: signal peptide peptidase SppA [Nitrospiraceae bacterium]|nr:signal peptide peptidase SppA [Nitrospiraceae bacterium]
MDDGNQKPSRRRSLFRRIVWGAVIVIGGLILLNLFFPDLDLSGENRIALIRVEGVILDAQTTIGDLKRFSENPLVKAIVLRIDSPGGGVAASQEIYDQIKWVRREKNKKVVASMGSVAASGGYYVAAAADRIVANPGTITGSIGVIAQWVNYGDLLKWAQLEPEVVKSGEFKDVGSPTRDLTPKEREYMQGLINQMYAQFINAIVEGRGDKGPPRERLMQLADGRVYTGEEAIKEKLIDDLGNYEAALRIAAEMGGIAGEPTVVTPPKPSRGSILDLFTKTDIGELVRGGVLNPPGASLQFQYLWK